MLHLMVQGHNYEIYIIFMYFSLLVQHVSPNFVLLSCKCLWFYFNCRCVCQR